MRSAWCGGRSSGALLIPYGPVAVLGALVSVGFAVALSPLFPVGLAGRIDPDKGVHLDSVVLLPGGVVVAIAVLLAAGVRGLAGERPARGGRCATARRRSPGPPGRSLPLPVGLGAGLAVDRGRGPRSLPTRPAIIGAVAAVTGVVGCFGLLHGIDDALATPARSGQVWNAGAFPDNQQQFDQLRTIARKDPAAAASGILERAPMTVGGAGIPVYAVTPLTGHRPFPVISGRAPRARTRSHSVPPPRGRCTATSDSGCGSAAATTRRDDDGHRQGPPAPGRPLVVRPGCAR